MHEPYWALRGEMLKKESERNAAVVEEKHQALRHLLQYLEEALGDKPYFLGEISLTDIDLLPRFLRMESYGADSNALITSAYCMAQKNEGAAISKVHSLSFAVISKFPLALPQLWDRS